MIIQQRPSVLWTRTPKDEELQKESGYGISNIVGALAGGLPTATYSQNVGIVTTTKVINRWVLGLAAVILGIAGIVPKFSAILTTIPQCVLGGATVSVFASIAMTGMKLVASAEMDYGIHPSLVLQQHWEWECLRQLQHWLAFRRGLPPFLGNPRWCWQRL